MAKIDIFHNVPADTSSLTMTNCDASDKDDLVILRGTVQIGITRSLLIRILEKRSGLNCGKDFFLSYMPERIVEGDALNEFQKIPQLVSGYTENVYPYHWNFQI